MNEVLHCLFYAVLAYFALGTTAAFAEPCIDIPQVRQAYAAGRYEEVDEKLKDVPAGPALDACRRDLRGLLLWARVELPPNLGGPFIVKIDGKPYGSLLSALWSVSTGKRHEITLEDKNSAVIWSLNAELRSPDPRFRDSNRLVLIPNLELKSPPSLEIHVDPDEEAKFEMDGKSLHVDSPVSVGTGQHEISLSRVGHESWSALVNVDQSGIQLHPPQLRPVLTHQITVAASAADANVGAKVTIDGKEGTNVPTEDGVVHDIQLDGPGMSKWRAKVQRTVEGTSSRLTVIPQSESSPAKNKLPAVVASAVTLVSAGAYIWQYTAAKGAEHDFNDSCRGAISGNCSQFRGTLVDAERARGRADVLAVTSILSGLVSAYLFFAY